MRFDLRLHGRTASGQECQADISVYAASQAELQREAQTAALTAAWITSTPSPDPVPEGSQITVEGVEKL